MYIHFDNQRMEVKVVCDVSESYSGSEEISKINAMVTELREKIQKFTVEEVNPLLGQIQDKIQAENSRLNPEQ